MTRDRWLWWLSCALAVGVTGWVILLNTSPQVTLVWWHPGQPTAHFSWRQRPPLVHHGLAKRATLLPSRTYSWQASNLHGRRLTAIQVNGQRTDGILLINGRPAKHVRLAGHEQFKAQLSATDGPILTLRLIGTAQSWPLATITINARR